MTPPDPRSIGHDRCLDLSRRDLLRHAAASLAAVPVIGPARALLRDEKVGPKPTDPAETAVARFYRTLTKEQRETIAFPFDHPKRSQVNNNWAIVKPTIADMSAEQQALCKEIMKGLCSEDGFERFMKQMEEDYGGFESYHVAVFGEPGTDRPFEWVLSGRHDTLRADGNSVEGVAFGGPIFYGHDPTGTGDDDAAHTGNVWWYQGRRANEIFASLDEAQQQRALRDTREPDAPRVIRLKGEEITSAPGLPVAELDGERKEMVRKLIADMLSPFRPVDVEEVQACLNDAGGVDALRLTYFKDGDIGNDRTWDIWKVEGPAFSWYFHGSPHVHTWLHVARKAEYQKPAEG
jgi:hypothetical protein